MKNLPQELSTLEQQLRAFVPPAPQTSPEQLLYQAGWEAALAQQTTTAATSPAAPKQQSLRTRVTYYWAAACAALILLSTVLAWQVWQQPQSHSFPITIVTVPMKSQPATNPASELAIAASESEDPRFTEVQPSGLASYLELRQRVTRGGLSMWPVSTPVPANPNNAAQTPSRDWQAELLREAL